MLPRPLPRSELVWITFLGVPLALDWFCDQGDPDGDTISEHTRRLFRTHTPVGKAAFAACATLGTGVLVKHICKAVG